MSEIAWIKEEVAKAQYSATPVTALLFVGSIPEEQMDCKDKETDAMYEDLKQQLTQFDVKVMEHPVNFQWRQCPYNTHTFITNSKYTDVLKALAVKNFFLAFNKKWKCDPELTHLTTTPLDYLANVGT